MAGQRQQMRNKPNRFSPDRENLANQIGGTGSRVANQMRENANMFQQNRENLAQGIREAASPGAKTQTMRNRKVLEEAFAKKTRKK